MMNKTRQGTSVDTRRIAEAVKTPGIDPRTWLTVAWVKNVVFDDKEGIFVDVVLESGEDETARLGAIYAGEGFGFYAPLEKDDMVLVAVPNGNFNAGAVVVQRLWSADSKAPTKIKNGDKPSGDVILWVNKDRHLRLHTEGAGNVFIVPGDNGKVKIGGEDGLEPAALATTLKNHLEAVKTWSTSHTHPFTYTKPAMGADTPSVTSATATAAPNVPDIEANNVEVK